MPESREEKNFKKSLWYYRNKERILRKMKEDYANNTNGVADKIKAKQKEIRDNNPEEIERRRALDKERNGLRQTLYWRWNNMLDRCNNPESKDYKNYGARGIKVIDNFNDFREYRKYMVSLMKEQNLKLEDIKEMHVDRINNNGNYEMGNVWFVSVKDNLENSRNPKNNPTLKKKRGDQ